ncbi:MAG: polysaccharide biosynthesis protein [Verrucomicrobiales bacterium]|nr:polysaccharide biosynthesis protein [Verrucomicrobiales bacterium]MCP5525556.1 polysaccharide biosynthesis protein [Verrucomicrobiales bacterium]
MSRFPRVSWHRLVALGGAYTVVLWASHTLAYLLRFDFDVPDPLREQLAVGWLWELPLRFALLALFGQFAGLLGYFSIPDFQRVVMAMGSASVVLYLIRFLPTNVVHPPRGVLLINFILTTAGITAVRLAFRILRERYLAPSIRDGERARRVAILGAGDVGASLARDLRSKRGLGLHPVVFLDDDPGKWRSQVHGVPVLGPPELLRRPRPEWRVEEVIIAMPSAPAKRLAELVQLLQECHLKFQSVPSMDQLATGKVRVSQLRPIEIQDLLGREAVEIETENIREILRGKVVMVTGAGGSIGSELCRQIAAFSPQRLLLVEQSEVQIFAIEQELVQSGHGGTILPLVADILDRPRMQYIFDRFKPQEVFHAAAHKHVPMMESQPSEALKNNSFGTAGLADLAVEHGVERFVLISTDKAINPTNVMGASKRLAEIYLQALYAANATKTKLMAVRFGNVLGSSGSVIPIFNRQIAAGGPVKVTHPEVTRYFMTIPEAVGLVLQSAAQGEGGEIFVLDMGKPVKIVDLARQLIELSGLRPDVDIEIEFVGLRPGEKLFEEISHHGENMADTHHPKIMRFVSQPRRIEEVRAFLDLLADQLHTAERNKLKMMLKEAVPEYQPYLV